MTSLSVTPAGIKMLKNYLELEAGRTPEGRWPAFYSTRMVDVMVAGKPAKGMLLSAGDGGAKATAKRLERAGLVHVRWNTERILVITDAGRALMAASEEASG